MKVKKKMFILIILILLIGIGVYFILNHTEKVDINTIEGEYIPQEEISEEQAKQTLVSTYFIDKQTEEVEAESRLISIMDLYLDPYTELLNLLIEGPKNSDLENAIPEGTILNSAILDTDFLRIDFSSEILNYDTEKEDMKEKMIETIVNTVTELTEVNEIRILVDGEEHDQFKDTYSRENIYLIDDE